MLCGAARGEEPVYEIAIPSMNAAEALNRFAEQTGAIMLFSYDLASARRSNAVRGRYTLLEGLELLLRGTGLSGGLSDKRVVNISQTGNAQRRGEETPVSNEKTSLRKRITAFFTSMLAASAASSQEANVETQALEEIVVTAQKRVERVQDVPVPVTAIDARPLTTTNQLRIEDYYRKIPGLDVALAGNGNEPALSIRGVTTGGADLGVNPTVGIMVDEVSYGAGATINGAQAPVVADIDPGELQRVEVLRGPQGTLYGAASIGGVLKFVTVDPSTERFSGRVQLGSVAVSDSNDSGYTARGAINVPLSDTLAVRASAFTARDPGYIDNAETGERDTNRRESEGARLAALWRPSDAFSVKLSAMYQDSERQGPSDVDTALGTDPRQEFLPSTGIYERKSEVYSATVNAMLGAVELISATGYNVDTLHDVLDLTKINLFQVDNAQALYGVGRVVTQADNETRKFTQEIRAIVPVGPRVDWLLGAFYTEEDTDIVGDTQAADDTGALRGLLFNGAFEGARFRELAAFTNVTVDLADRWDVQFGGRFSDHEQSFPFTITVPDVPNDPLVIPLPALSSDDTAFTYLVTPRFKVSPDLMVYARFASGYRPGGANVLCGAEPDVPCSFKPDTTKNYDVGFKGSFAEGKVAIDASVYYIDWKDIQIAGIYSASRQAQSTQNASRAKSQGVEVSIETTFGSGLDVTAWFAYNDAKATDDFPPGTLAGRAGDRLPYSSRLSGSLSLDQRTPLWGDVTGLFGATFSYIGDRMGDFQESLTRQHYPSYTQLDLRASLLYESWTLDLFANNVTDEKGILRAGLDSNVPTYEVYTQPRTVGISLSKSF